MEVRRLEKEKAAGFSGGFSKSMEIALDELAAEKGQRDQTETEQDGA